MPAIARDSAIDAPTPLHADEIGRNVAASYASWAVRTLSPLILVPLLVRLLGHELYGQWVVILSLTAYLGLAQVGMGQTVGNGVAEAAAADRASDVGAIVSTAFFFYATVSALVLAGCGLAWLGGAGRMLPVRLQPAEIAFGALIVLTALAFPLNTHKMALRGLQRVDLEQGLSLGVGFARIVALATVLLLGFKLISVAIVHGLSVLGSGVVAYVVARNLRSDARPRIARFSPRLLRRMLKPSAAFFALDVASSIAFTLDSLVIAYALGASEVTRYSVPFQIVFMAAGFLTVALAALTPNVTAHYALGEREVLARGYIFFSRVTVVYGACATLFLWFGGEALLRLWTGRGVFPGYTTFGLLLALLFIQCLLAPAEVVLRATSRHYTYAALALIEAFLNLGLSLWWVRWWGMPGVIAGTVAGRLLTNGWYMPLAAMHASGLKARELIGGAGRTAAVSVAGFAALVVLFAPWDAHSTTGAIGRACALTAALCAASLSLGVTREERVSTIQRIARLPGILTGGWRAADRLTDTARVQESPSR